MNYRSDAVLIVSQSHSYARSIRAAAWTLEIQATSRPTGPVLVSAILLRSVLCTEYLAKAGPNASPSTSGLSSRTSAILRRPQVSLTRATLLESFR